MSTISLSQITEHLSTSEPLSLSDIVERAYSTHSEVLRCLSDWPDAWWQVEKVAVEGDDCFRYRLRTVMYPGLPKP